MYKILDRELNEHKTVTFAELCSTKNIKPKLGFFKRVLNVRQGDRVSTAYPCTELVANWFGLKDLPLDEFDQPSSWSATVKYIETMYGAEYTKGFERADYPKLRKAA
jgi:hypothetical protein